MESFKTKERHAGGKAKWALSVFVSLTEWAVAAENTSEDIWVALLQIRLLFWAISPQNIREISKASMIIPGWEKGDRQDFPGSWRQMPYIQYVWIRTGFLQ